MTIWLILSLVALAATLLTVQPLLARRIKAPDRLKDADYLSDQLEAVERDRAAGALAGDLNAEELLEAQRRLAAAETLSQAAAEKIAPAFLRQTIVVLMIAAPIAALGLYAKLGNAELRTTEKGVALAARSAQSTQSARGPAADISALEALVSDDPQNPDNWVLLAEARANEGSFQAAAVAFAKAAALAPGRAYLHAGEGEAIAMAAGGVVTEAAHQAFDRALGIDAQEPRARFYKAIALEQTGDAAGALAGLQALAASAPADAPWLSAVQGEARRIARSVGGPGGGVAAASDQPRRGPSAEDVAAVAGMSAEDRLAMINNMVAGLESRLAEAPDDLEGWLMLARSYQVMGEANKSREAMARAADLAPEDLSIQTRYAQSLLSGAEALDAPIDATTRAVLTRIYQLAPEQPFALFFLGLAARQDGDIDAARTYWEALLPLLPQDDPQTDRVRGYLESLPVSPSE